MSKQFYTWFTCCLFALLTALPLSVNADELTVNDGTTTSEYVPVHGLWADAYTRSQSIIPARLLAEMIGGEISSMKFYTSTSSASWGAANFEVRLVEVGDSVFSTAAFEDISKAVKVYEGTLSVSNQRMEVTFTTNYTYGGGNLLIEVGETTKGSYTSCSFYGVSKAGGSVQAYSSSSYDAISPSIKAFLPKVTFGYEAAASGSCAKPGAIALDSVTTNSATFFWTASEAGEEEWYVRVKDAQGVALADFDSVLVSDTFCTISGLNPSTEYNLSVEVVHNCEGGESAVRNGSLSFATECVAITTFPWEEGFESMSAGTLNAVCWANEHLSGAGSSLFEVSTTTNGSNSSHQLKLPDMSSGTFTKLTLPQMDIPAANAYEFIISVYRNATSASYAQEGLFVLAGADTLAFISRLYSTASEGYLNEVPAEAASGWYTYKFTIPNAGEQSISLVGRSKYGSATYADNLKVSALPTCLPVKKVWVDEESITTNSVKLAWHPSTTAGDYQVVVKNGPIELANERVDADTTFVLSELNHSTAYKNLNVTITTICSATDSSESYSGKVSFTTVCKKIEFESDSLILGFEDYDSYASLASIPCWDTIRGAGVTADWSVATTAYKGSKGAYIYAPGAGKYAVLVSPQVEVSSDYEFQAYFKESSHYASDSLIFYVNSESSLEGAIRIGQIDSLTTSWQRFRQPLETGDWHILIQAYGEGTIYVDQLSFVPEMKCMPPTDLKMDSISDNMVRFSWTPAEGQTAWNIRIGDTRGDIGVGLEEAEPVYVPYYELTDLDPLYEDTVLITVYGVCDAYESVEVLEDIFAFKTLDNCPIPASITASNVTANTADIAWGIGLSDSYNVQYRVAGGGGVIFSEDFENGIGDWTLRDCHSSTGVSSTSAHSGAKGFYFYYSSYPPQYLISPEIVGIGTNDTLELYYGNNSSYYEETFQVGFSSTDNATASFTFGEEQVADDEAWHKYAVAIPAGTKYICIQCTSDDQYYFYIDDITIKGTPIEAGEWIAVEGSDEEKQMTISDLTPETRYEAQVQGVCDGGATEWSESVFFTTTPACLVPSAPQVKTIGSDSAVISWKASHDLYYVLVMKDSTVLFQDTAYAADSVVLRELAHSTLYNVKVSLAGICDEESHSDTIVKSLSFATNCMPIDALPWSENFDGYTPSTSERVIPVCWSAINTSTSSSYQGYPSIIEDSYAPTAPNSMAFYSYGYSSSDPQDQYAILPEIDNISALRMKLYAAAYNNYDATFTVGVMSDPSDTSTFVAIATNTPASEDFAPYTISFADYEGQGKHIAIKMAAASGSTYRCVFIDDIRVEEIPGCLEPDSLEAIAESITAHSAALTWKSQSNESAWQMRYKKSADTAWVNVDALITTDTFTLDNLAPYTSYDVQVAAWCDPTNEEAKSQYSNAANFRTSAGVPFLEQFEATTLPAGWSRDTALLAGVLNGGALTPYSGGWVFNTDNGVFDNHTRLNIYGTSCKTWLITPSIEMEDNVQLTFNLALTAYSGTLVAPATDGADDKFVVLISEDNGATWSILRQWDNAGSADVYNSISHAANGQLETIDLSNYTNKSVKIAFYGESTVSNADNNIHIDNVNIEVIPDCPKPTGLAASNITVSGATFSWDAIEDGAWQYAVVLASADEPADADYVAATDTFVVISDKADNTAYVFYLRQVCAEGVASPSISVPFHTLQLPVAVGSKFTDNFEDGNNWLFANSTKHGWVLGETVHNGEGTHAMYVSTDNGTTHSYNNSGVNIVFASKAFTFTDGNYIFRYDWMAKGEGSISSDYDYLRVALVPASVSLSAGAIPSGFTQSTLPTGWIALDGGSLLNSKNSWQSFESAEKAIAAGEYNVVFAWKNDGSMGSNPPAAIDNFSISKITCVKPTNVTVALADITSSTAIVRWAADSLQNAWQIALDTVSSFNPDTLSSLISADTNMYILAGLKAATNYYLYVRTDCGVEDGYSEWSKTKVSFVTKAGNLAPTGLAVNASSLASDAAVVEWQGVATNDLHESFELYYSQLAVRPDTLKEDSLILAINDTMYVLNGLSPETTYYVWVRDNCGEDGLSAWTAAISFTTLADCAVPANLSVDSVTAHTADIAWEIGNSDSYNVRYRIPAGLNVLFSEGFENGIGAWTLRDCHASTGIASAAKHEGSNGFKFNYKSNPPQYLISPELSDINAEAVLEFYYKNSSTSFVETFQVGFSSTDNATASFTFGEEVSASDGAWHLYHAAVPAGTKFVCFKLTSDDKFYLYIDDIIIGAPMEAAEWTVVNGTEAKELQLIGLDPETKYEAQVQGVCDTTATEWSEEIIEFTTIEACFVPTGLKVSNVKSHTANLEWVSDAEAWQICLDGDEENLINVTDTAFVLTDLAADTLHTVKVRTNCGDEGFSKWSNTISFTTLVACPAPTGVVVKDIRSHSAELNWVSDAAAWQICLDGDEENLIEVTDTMYVFTGLASDTLHSVKVRANCGEDDGVSLWSSISFTTLVACPAPTGLKAELTPGDGSVALLSWDALDANAWVVEYSLNANMSDSISIAVEAATIGLEGLTAESKYYARVKADCGEEDGESLWSAVISFIPTDKYEIIVNDGTVTNGYVPVNGLNVDHLTHSQFIVPALDLVEIDNDTIVGLTFFASTETAAWANAMFEVYVAEVESESISAYNEWSAMDQVMDTAHLEIADNQMVVTFSNPYVYAGGNLLIGFNQTVVGTWTSSYWYGVTANGASVSNYDDGTVTQRNFLPKMKITFIPGENQTGVEEIHNGNGSDIKVVKFIRDNRVYILREGVVYDILGTKVQ